MLRDSSVFTADPGSRLLDEENRIRDTYARRDNDQNFYSWDKQGHVFAAQERERQMISALRDCHMFPLTGRRILEVGCGNGSRIRDFVKWGARPRRIFGVELLEEPAAEARDRCPDGVTIECRNAEHLPYRSRSFDIVVQATVFSSILDPALKQKVAREMLRVVKPDGIVLWYDMHLPNPWNRAVKPVSRQEICSLFEGCDMTLRSVCLAPPITRWLAERSWLATYLLSKFPMLCTHYLGVIHPHRGSDRQQPLNLRA